MESKYQSLSDQNENIKSKFQTLSSLSNQQKQQQPNAITGVDVASDTIQNKKPEQDSTPPPTLSDDNDNDESKEDYDEDGIWNSEKYGFNKLLRATRAKYINRNQTPKDKDETIINLGMKLAQCEAKNAELRASNESLRTALEVLKYEHSKHIKQIEAEYAAQMIALNGNSWPQFVKFITLNQESKYPLGGEQQIALGVYYIAKQWEHLKSIKVQDNDKDWDWEAYHKIGEVRNYWCHDCSNRCGARNWVRDWATIEKLMGKFRIYQ